MTDRSVLIVGASLAGATTAMELRRLGHEGPITLLGAERHLPYERPGLSKEYLSGSLPQEKLLVHAQDKYDAAGIGLRLGVPAATLDSDARRVHLADGESVSYETLVITTGSENLRPPIPGIDRAGVHQLRTIDDADRMRADCAQPKRVVVVGMGFIGCEVSSTLAAAGHDVTAVDALPGPLWAQLGPTYSAIVGGWMEQHGVKMLPNVAASAFDGAEHVEAERLTDGRVLHADLVVVGVGVRPVTNWLTGSGLAMVRGAIAVDQQGRTSLPGIYAAGDVSATRQASGDYRHVEHWSSAIEQGKRVAAAIAGAPAAEGPLPVSWFWSDQYGHNLQYAGQHRNDDDLVIRDDGSVGFFLRDGVLGAVAAVDSRKDFRRAMALIGQTVDPSILGDPDTDLRTLNASSV